MTITHERDYLTRYHLMPPHRYVSLLFDIFQSRRECQYWLSYYQANPTEYYLQSKHLLLWFMYTQLSSLKFPSGSLSLYFEHVFLSANEFQTFSASLCGYISFSRIFSGLVLLLFWLFMIVGMFYYGMNHIRSQNSWLWLVVAVGSFLQYYLLISPVLLWLRYIQWTTLWPTIQLYMQLFIQRSERLLRRRHGLVLISHSKKKRRGAAIQYLSSACRSARKLPHLAMSRLLLSINDNDLPVGVWLDNLTTWSNLVTVIQRSFGWFGSTYLRNGAMELFGSSLFSLLAIAISITFHYVWFLPILLGGFIFTVFLSVLVYCLRQWLSYKSFRRSEKIEKLRQNATEEYDNDEDDDAADNEFALTHLHDLYENNDDVVFQNSLPRPSHSPKSAKPIHYTRDILHKREILHKRPKPFTWRNKTDFPTSEPASPEPPASPSTTKAPEMKADSRKEVEVGYETYGDSFTEFEGTLPTRSSTSPPPPPPSVPMPEKAVELSNATNRSTDPSDQNQIQRRRKNPNAKPIPEFRLPDVRRQRPVQDLNRLRASRDEVDFQSPVKINIQLDEDSPPISARVGKDTVLPPPAPPTLPTLSRNRQHAYTLPPNPRASPPRPNPLARRERPKPSDKPSRDMIAML